MLEFALVAPALIALIMGLFQYGWAMHCASNVSFALREASRAMYLNPAMNSDTVEAMIEDRLVGARPEAVTVEISTTQQSPEVRLARIDATYVHTVLVPFMNGATLTFRSAAVVPVLNS